MATHKRISGDYNLTLDSGTGIMLIDGLLSVTGPVKLPSYTTAQANALADPQDGQLIYVTDGNSGSPCLAVRSAGAWRRIALGSAISI